MRGNKASPKRDAAPVSTCIYSGLKRSSFGMGRRSALSFGTLLQTGRKSGTGDHRGRKVVIKVAGAKGFLHSL